MVAGIETVGRATMLRAAHDIVAVPVQLPSTKADANARQLRDEIARAADHGWAADRRRERTTRGQHTHVRGPRKGQIREQHTRST